jgi:CelD/BcsL family acetyltransferase involved in cellulose biosynthesis
VNDIGTDRCLPVLEGRLLIPQRGDVTLPPARSAEEWERVCAAFPQATAFHRYDFLESVASSLNGTFVPLLVLLQGQPVGVAPLLLRQLGPFRTLNWTPFPYLGPLVPDVLIPETLAALRTEARRQHAVNHQQCFSELIADRPADGFTELTDRTFVVPLAGRSDEELLAAMHATRRNEVRRAQRAGFEVRMAQSEDFPLMEVWVRQVFAVQGLPPPYRPGTFSHVFDTLADAPGASFVSARLNGRTVAVAIVLETTRRSFLWQYGVDPLHRSRYPHLLLIWQSLLRARNAGAIEFDLVGAPNKGIASYKSRFGALERQYSVVRREAMPHKLLSAAHRTALPWLARRGNGEAHK